MNNNGNNIIRNYLIRTIVLGAYSVGKTSLINTYLGQEFNPDVYPTNYTDYYSKRLEFDGKTFNIKITDTPAGERYRNIIRTYLRYVRVIILVFDMTNKRSFLELEGILDLVHDTLENKATLILIGNKSDLSDNFKLREKEGIEFAKILNASFYLSSAKDNPNGIREFLDNCFKKYIEDNQNEFRDNGQNIRPLNNNNLNRRRRRNNFC